MKEYPRYNVVSCRLSDTEYDEMKNLVGSDNISAFIWTAIKDRLAQERKNNAQINRTETNRK